MSHSFAGVIAAVLIVGCGGCRSVGAAPPSPPLDPLFRIERDAVGPIRLGMTHEAASKVEGFKAADASLRLKGIPTPVLRYEHSGEVVAVAEFAGGKVSRLRVLSARFRTPEGAHVGSEARELGKRYGAGKVFAGEGAVCAVFANAPGRSFCFRTTPDLLVKPDWKKVATRNPTVEVILVTPVK